MTLGRGDFWRGVLQQLAVDLDRDGRFERFGVGCQRALLLLKEDVLYGTVLRCGSLRGI